MTSRVLEIEATINPDREALEISNMWVNFDMYRAPAKQIWEEIRRYVFATDTTHTTNASLPWRNKTTVPKLCQIRDNLFANYMATMFPKRKWLHYEAGSREELDLQKVDAIINYMSWTISQPLFKHEMEKIILDYIDYGNCFATVEWVDQRSNQDNKTQSGYVGPALRRISPLDIVFNPTAENFESSPKIVRSLISLGDLKEMLERMSNDENRAEYEELWDYLKNIRANVSSFEGEVIQKDNLYTVDGFGSFRDYLSSNMVEILTFYGDMYDTEKDIFYKNHVITVVDRHKVLGKKPNPSFFGYPPIFHCVWRKRQDNLWGMGPLDNLLGLQYRLDHVENMKADIYDLTTFPVQKVKGFVQDYTWQPGEKIYTDEEGDVDLVVPDVNALQANFEIDNLKRQMEEMAGAPREALGIRTPGEKTAHEVRELSNASGRLYQSKITHFEEHVSERVLNAKLELARRNMTGVMAIRVFNDEMKFQKFQELTVEDITGIGRIKPIGARHFAEQADLVQNLTALGSSPILQVIMPHVSSVQMAKMIEHALNLEDYEVILPWVALAEQAEAQKQANAYQEQVMGDAATASGMGEDFDLPPEQQQAFSELAVQQGLGMAGNAQ